MGTRRQQRRLLPPRASSAVPRKRSPETEEPVERDDPDGMEMQQEKRQKGTRRNIQSMVDDSSVDAVLPTRILSTLTASPGSSLKSINSVSKENAMNEDEMDDRNMLRQVPIMESEAQSKQGSNDPSDTKEKDALEKSTTGTNIRRDDLRSTKQQRPSETRCNTNRNNTNNNTTACMMGPVEYANKMVPGYVLAQSAPLAHQQKYHAIPSSMKDSGTHMDMSRLHHASARSDVPPQKEELCQQSQTREGLKSLNKYYVQTQQYQMHTMSNLINDMAQTAGDMIKQGYNPASLNLSAAIRACSLANIIMYKVGCLGTAAARPHAIIPPVQGGPPTGYTTRVIPPEDIRPSPGGPGNEA